MLKTYVRLALTEEEFARLLELIADAEDAVAYKLRSKGLALKSRQIAATETPSKRAAKR